MALKAGRVGVSPTEVDKNGHITGGGSSVTVVDNLTSTSSTDALSAKQGKVLKDLTDTKEDASKIGGFEFRTNEGQAQYRTSSTGEWQNFSSASGDGIVLSEAVAPTVGYGTLEEGGYQEIDGYVYFNCLIHNTGNTLALSNIPKATGSNTLIVLKESTGAYLNGKSMDSSTSINFGNYSYFNDTVRVIGVYKKGV